MKNTMRIEDQGREVALDSSNYSYLNLGTGERVISTIAGVLLASCGAYLSKKRPQGMREQSWYGLASIPVGMYLIKRGITGYCPLNNVIGRNTAEKEDFESIELQTRVVVDKPRSEVYELWRNLQNLPAMLPHLKRIEVLDDKTSEWTVCIPDTFFKVKWKAEIVDEIPNELISWRSLEDSEVGNSGEIMFTDLPDGNRTEVEVSIRYFPPAGKLGKGVAKMFSARFRRMLEKEIENIG